MKKDIDKNFNDAVESMAAEDTLKAGISRRFFLISASVFVLGGIDRIFQNKSLAEISDDYSVINGWVIPKKMLSNGHNI